ncbi:hypothetical protein LTR84_004638 [Exophiala bonariae]|uniref:Transcription factor domain-containing protein n=1 Tax=Exophiala bonariae TaxID=1690606 RepID=A0AAV9NRJ7_9EURO|nr:hypothetical protein LTR84_004638 [Exophiala bonariae]
MVIAPQLDWIDTSQNIYRNDIPLISLEIPSVRWALLALAAGDLGSMLTSNSMEPRPDYLSMQDKLQHEALGPLTAHIYQLTHNPHPYGSLSVDELRGLLVSMFLLVSLGIRTGRGPIWRLHMRAAYAISHAWLAADDTHLEDDDGIEKSIIALLSEFQTWSSITAIDRPPNWNLRISCNRAEGPFHKYVSIIRHITELARDQRFSSNQSISTRNSDCLRKDIKEARRIATVQIQKIDFQTRQARQSFSAMIDIYYQATLIYFFRVKGDDCADQASCTIARNHLFESLRGVFDMESIAHCLAWPLLIAGTECHDCIDDQIFIEHKMLEVIKMTGGLDRARMMGLLRELWATGQQQTVVNWITMAKQWDRVGDPILIQ